MIQMNVLNHCFSTKIQKPLNYAAIGSRILLSKGNMEQNKIQKYIETINHGSGDVREEAVKSLGKIGSDAIEAVPTLIDAVKEDALCWEAVNALGMVGGKTAMHALCDSLLNDSDMGVRFRAGDSLGKIKDKEAVPTLIKALSDRDEFVRESAASALGKIGDQRATNALNEALSDSSEFVSKMAKKALNEIVMSDKQTSEIG